MINVSEQTGIIDIDGLRPFLDAQSTDTSELTLQNVSKLAIDVITYMVTSKVTYLESYFTI